QPPPALRHSRRPRSGHRPRLDRGRHAVAGAHPRPHPHPVRGRGLRLPVLRSGLELRSRLADAMAMTLTRLIPLAAAFALLATPAAAQDAPRWSFAIHGGAGVIERDSLTPEQDAAYRAA